MGKSGGMIGIIRIAVE